MTGSSTSMALRRPASNTVWAVLCLAVPVLAEQLLAIGVGLVDTWLTGRYLPGDKYLAAIGQMAYLLWMIPSLFTFVSIGATALVARHVGAGRQEEAEQSAHQAFLLGGILAVAVTLILWIGGDRLIDILQLPAEPAELAKQYLQIVVWVIPAIMIERMAIACLHGAGDTVSGMLTRVTVNISNIILSIGFVQGWGPLPSLGWRGIAMGTSLSHIIGATILIVLLARGRAGLQLRWSGLRWRSEQVRRLLNIGVPGGLDVLLILICHLWFVALINGLGTAQAAAHSLAIRIESLAYLPGTAFEVAAMTLAGQYLGASDRMRAQRSVWVALWMGAAVMSLAGLIYYEYGFQLGVLFGGEANRATAERAAVLLRIIAFAMPPLAIAMVVGGALRGAGDTRWVMVANLIGMLGVRIPLMYAFLGPLADWVAPDMSTRAEQLLNAAWYVMIISVVVRAVLIFYRFFQGGWQTREV